MSCLCLITNQGLIHTFFRCDGPVVQNDIIVPNPISICFLINVVLFNLKGFRMRIATLSLLLQLITTVQSFNIFVSFRSLFCLDSVGKSYSFKREYESDLKNIYIMDIQDTVIKTYFDVTRLDTPCFKDIKRAYTDVLTAALTAQVNTKKWKKIKYINDFPEMQDPWMPSRWAYCKCKLCDEEWASYSFIWHFCDLFTNSFVQCSPPPVALIPSTWTSSRSHGRAMLTFVGASRWVQCSIPNGR